MIETDEKHPLPLIEAAPGKSRVLSIRVNYIEKECRKILIAVDGSKCGDDALDWAIKNVVR